MVCGCVQSRAGGAAAAHVMRMQIQATDMPKFHVNQYLHLSRIDSGIDSLKAEVSGHEKAFWSLPMHLYGRVLVESNEHVGGAQLEGEGLDEGGLGAAGRRGRGRGRSGGGLVCAPSARPLVHSGSGGLCARVEREPAREALASMCQSRR